MEQLYLVNDIDYYMDTNQKSYKLCKFNTALEPIIILIYISTGPSTEKKDGHVDSCPSVKVQIKKNVCFKVSCLKYLTVRDKYKY